MPFASLPPALSSRLRALGQTPNFGIFFRGETGRVTFPYLVDALKNLGPLQPDERSALTACLLSFVEAQLFSGALGNLNGAATLLPVLELEELRLPGETLTWLTDWSARISLTDWQVIARGFRILPQKLGQQFESEWFQDFLPNYLPDGLERAVRRHTEAYLRKKNAWVMANDVGPETVDRLWRARETLMRLANLPPAKRKKGVPPTLRGLLGALGVS